MGDAMPRGMTFVDVFFRICDLPPCEKIFDKSHFSYSKQKEIDEVLKMLGDAHRSAWNVCDHKMDVDSRKKYVRLAKQVLNGKCLKEAREATGAAALCHG